ncbi:MAG TPA: hypothetical protein VGE67_09430 [Haloferula sp.]
MYKALAKGLIGTEILIVLAGAAWAGFFPAHIKRAFDASPESAFVLFTFAASVILLAVALVLFSGTLLYRTCRRAKT